jgi:hypothetical protein
MLTLPKHKYGVLPYAATLVFPMLNSLATNSDWWTTNVKPLMDAYWQLSIAFMLGLLVQDLVNPNSWLREAWRLLTRKFEIVTLETTFHAAPQRLILHAHIRFLANVPKGRLALKIFGTRPSGVFRAPIRDLENITKGEQMTLVLATRVLAHPGWIPYHSTWGDAPLSVNLNAPSFFPRPRNVACLELIGGWLTQRQRILVADTSYDPGHDAAGIYVQDEEEDPFRQ